MKLKDVKVRLEMEAESADFYVCGSSSHFDDDIEAPCQLCGQKIYHRPHAPKKPAKICLLCAEINAGLSPDGIEVGITPKVAAEILEHFR